MIHSLGSQMAVFMESTEHSVRQIRRQKFGAAMYKMCPEEIFVRREGIWRCQFLASHYEKATAWLCGTYLVRRKSISIVEK